MRETPVPVMFGAADAGLFGCHHQPAGEPRDHAVVICQPTGQEYIRAHRAMLQLAIRLARTGFPVLRFDYYGTGDSAGDSDRGGIGRWIGDVAAAVTEARNRTGAVSTCLIGVRLGGALAALATARIGAVDTMVLWEPVIDGSATVGELDREQRRLLRFGFVQPTAGRSDERFDEILGMPFPPELRHELEAIDLLRLPSSPAARVLVIENGRGSGVSALQAHLATLGTAVDHMRARDPQFWLAEPYKGLVPHHSLEAIVAWIARNCP